MVTDTRLVELLSALVRIDSINPDLVESLEEALDGHHVVAEPFDVFGEVRVAFVEVDGAPVEFVQPY